MGKNTLKKQKTSKLLFFAIGLLGLVLAIFGFLFTNYPAKALKKAQAILRPTPSEKDKATLALQIEQKLREEFDQKLKQELADLKATEKEDERQQENHLTSEEERGVTLSPNSIKDVRLLRSGIPFHTKVEWHEGRNASIERVEENSFTAEYIVKLHLPQAAKKLEELEASNPKLASILPGLPPLLEQANVSPYYQTLYETKLKRIQQNSHDLSEILTKHNVYDCETILHLTTTNGRKVFYMQADMDVVSDGSDGDRLAAMPDEIVNSSNYQPFTSYGWKKQTASPNPMIAGWERRMIAGTEEMNAPGTSSDRKKWLQERISMLKRGIEDLKARSYLIAEYDPFIVIPVNLLTNTKDPFAPKVGDYAVVIFEERIFPCIVGDGGPSFKVGEASLRLAKEINAKANPYSRPISELKATYLVFPGTREKQAGPPNYLAWKEKCQELLQEIGGLGTNYSLHTWVDLFPKAEKTE